MRKKILKGQATTRDKKYVCKPKILRGNGNCQEEKMLGECDNYQRQKCTKGLRATKEQKMLGE